MPNCETCKHWYREAWPNGMGWHNQGTCDALQVSGGRHVVALPFHANPLLRTNHDFGCNRHEPREDRNG